MALDATWQLPTQLAALSTTPWPQAIHEWKLKKITLLGPGEESSQCICGHIIRELCHIENRINHNETIVGNHCVRLFAEDGAEESVFSTIPRIFEACGRILQDKSHSANEGLIQLAYERGVFTENDRSFYRDIWLKRNLSRAQENFKTMLNNKLIHQMMLSPRAAYQRLVERPTETTGPDLINLAHEKGKLTDHEWRHYRNNWYKVGKDEINPSERSRLNRKIIDGLRDQMNLSPNS